MKLYKTNRLWPKTQREKIRKTERLWAPEIQTANDFEQD